MSYWKIAVVVVLLVVTWIQTRNSIEERKERAEKRQEYNQNKYGPRELNH